MRLAYVDSCVWITLIEGLEHYRAPIRGALAALTHDGWMLCTSDAVRLEVMVRPLRLKDDILAGPHFRSLAAIAPVLIALPDG